MKVNPRAKRLIHAMGVMSDFFDKWMTRAASGLKMCGDGPRNNWAVMVSRIFYTECPCCLFWRGVTVGTALTMIAVALVLTLYILKG